MAKCRIGTAKFFALLLLLYHTKANDERNKGAFVMGAEAMDINTLLSRSQSLAQSKGKGGEK